MALYGYTNKVLAEIYAHLMKHPELTKFLYYTDNEYKEKDILEQEKPTISDIANKKIFMYKRVEETVKDAGAYMFIDVYRITPTKIGGKIREVTFTVDILVHQDCVDTMNGNRAICILCALEESLGEYVKKHSIGSIDLIRVAPILGIIKEFIGYQMQFKAYGFNGD